MRPVLAGYMFCNRPHRRTHPLRQLQQVIVQRRLTGRTSDLRPEVVNLQYRLLLAGERNCASISEDSAGRGVAAGGSLGGWQSTSSGASLGVQNPHDRSASKVSSARFFQCESFRSWRILNVCLPTVRVFKRKPVDAGFRQPSGP